MSTYVDTVFTKDNESAIEIIEIKEVNEGNEAKEVKEIKEIKEIKEVKRVAEKNEDNTPPELTLRQSNMDIVNAYTEGTPDKTDKEVIMLRTKLEKIQGADKVLAEEVLSCWDRYKKEFWCSRSAFQNPHTSAFLYRLNNNRWCLSSGLRYNVAVCIARRLCDGHEYQDLSSCRTVALWRAELADDDLVTTFGELGLLGFPKPVMLDAEPFARYKCRSYRVVHRRN